MKQLLVILFLLLCTNNLCAQDVIVKKDGDIIRSKVLEVTPTDIKYKKQSNPNGPTYTINISDVMSVNYENGENESFDNINAKQEDENEEPQFISKPADARNTELIALYNRRYEPSSKIKKSNEVADRCLVFVGMKKSSIISNDEIEINLETKKTETPYGADCWCQGLVVKNKTNRDIYIDKARCFRLLSEDSEFVYSNYTFSDRIVTIAPYSSKYLVDEKWEGYKWLEGYERFRFKLIRPNEIGLHKGVVNVGQVKMFEPEDLPWNRKYYISYSFDKSYKTYSILFAEFYIKEIIGCKSLMSPMNYRITLGLLEGELKYDRLINCFDSFTIVGYHKFDTVDDSYRSSSYVAESPKRNEEQNALIAGAITGAAFSTINAFTQMQNGGGAINNSRSSTSGSSISGGSTGYGTSSYSSSSSSSSSGSSSKSKGPVCRNCNGGGKCPSCHGKGIRTDNSFGTGTDPTKKCGVCGGDGICNLCGGSGHKN